MRTFKILSLALIGILTMSIFSCKKGEEDPFLSFKSRQKRISGEWEMTDITGIIKRGESEDNLYESYSYTFQDGLLIETNTINGETLEIPYLWELTFNKDGTFNRKVDRSTEIFENYTLYNGGYFFLGRNKTADAKKGQFLSIVTDQFVRINGETEEKESLTSPNRGERYELKRLTEDEMIIKWIDNAEAFSEFHLDGTEDKNYWQFELELKFSKK